MNLKNWYEDLSVKHEWRYITNLSATEVIDTIQEHSRSFHSPLSTDSRHPVYGKVSSGKFYLQHGSPRSEPFIVVAEGTCSEMHYGTIVKVVAYTPINAFPLIISFAAPIIVFIIGLLFIDSPWLWILIPLAWFAYLISRAISARENINMIRNQLIIWLNASLQE